MVRRAGEVVHQVRQQVQSAVGREGSRLRSATSLSLLAILSAATLAPIGVALAGGPAAAIALADVASNIGSGHIAGIVSRLAARLRGQDGGPPSVDAFREALRSELETALARTEPEALALHQELVAVVESVNGFEAALEAKTGDIHDHLAACFSDLQLDTSMSHDWLQAIHTDQQNQTRILKEVAARTAPAVTAVGIPVVVPAGAADPAASASATTWQAGAEVSIGSHDYMLFGDLVAEQRSRDGAALLRQAQGLRLRRPERRRPSTMRHAWLRQVETTQHTPVARDTTRGLSDQRDLLDQLSPTAGLPRVVDLVAEPPRTTLEVEWPATNSGEPFETLAKNASPGTPLARWDLQRLCRGMADLCQALRTLHTHGASHRQLHPDAILTSPDGSLTLRDVGLATTQPTVGEGRSNYRAPEQRRRSRHIPGPATDAFGLGAIIYYLTTGQEPALTHPLPIDAALKGLIPRQLVRVVDAALSTEPTSRPDLDDLAATLDAARREPV